MKAFPYRIVVEFSEEDECWIARVPALPNCAAHGDTAEDAIREGQVAARAMVKVLGAQAPEPDNVQPSGNIRLRLPRSLHADLERRATLEEVSLNQLMVSILSHGIAGSAEGGRAAAPTKRQGHGRR